MQIADYYPDIYPAVDAENDDDQPDEMRTRNASNASRRKAPSMYDEDMYALPNETDDSSTPAFLPSVPRQESVTVSVPKKNRGMSLKSCPTCSTCPLSLSLPELRLWECRKRSIAAITCIVVGVLGIAIVIGYYAIQSNGT